MQNDPPLGPWATFLRSVTLPLEKSQVGVGVVGLSRGLP